MEIAQLFMQRHDVLYDFWLGHLWSSVSEDLMRRRPDPPVNSLAWNLWHLSRVEDAGLNRFVTDGSQVLDDGGWPQAMNVPWRHHGSNMSFDEVDDLSRRIDLQALRGYADAVRARTREIVNRLDPADLDGLMPAGYLRRLLVDEGLAHSEADGFVQNYTGWTKGKCLMNFGLTHPYQHVGEMGVIAGLLGLVQ